MYSYFPGLYCNITWDGISCWPATKAGTVAVKPCPDYINRLDPTGKDNE